MGDALTSILGGSCGAAVAAGVLALVQDRAKRRDSKSDRADATQKALRYIMLYIIQERGERLLLRQRITLEERRDLHRWHELYHAGLGGNGDAALLMEQIDRLPLFSGQS